MEGFARHLWLKMISAVIFAGTLAELLFIGAVEGGIIVEAAGGTGTGGGRSVQNHIAGADQALDGDISADGSAGGLLEASAELGFAGEEPFAQAVQRKICRQVVVDIAQNPVHGRILRG